MVDLPWNRETKDKLDISQARYSPKVLLIDMVFKGCQQDAGKAPKVPDKISSISDRFPTNYEYCSSRKYPYIPHERFF